MGRGLPSRLARLRRDESGGATIWMAIWMLGFMMLGGLAVDAASAWRASAMLQATADAAAHAGATVLPDEEDAQEAALETVELNMPNLRHGEVTRAAQIAIGNWDHETRIFTEGSFATLGDIPDAVRVRSFRSAANANPVATTLLRLIGLRAWDVGAEAIVQRVVPGCMYNGLISREFVDLNSNNVLLDGICIIGKGGVGVNNNNSFSEGVIVGMPNLADLVTPNSDWEEQNPGLREALREDWLDPKVLDHIQELFYELEDPDSDYQPSYVDPGLGVIYETRSAFDVENLAPNAIHYVSCSGANQKITIPAGTILNQVVILSECKVQIGTDVLIVSSTIAAVADGEETASVEFGSGVTLGLDDACTAGGGSRVITDGDVHSAAKLSIYGSQIIAGGLVDIAAQASGLEGASVIAQERIDVTSNNSFGGCWSDADDVVALPVYRLIR